VRDRHLQARPWRIDGWIGWLKAAHGQLRMKCGSRFWGASDGWIPDYATRPLGTQDSSHNNGSDMQDVVAAHKHSSNHRDELMASTMCGCFHCLATFGPSAIKDWVDWPQGTPDDLQLEKGTTALCPGCGIDSVIGTASGFSIDAELLADMQRHWF
jgi:hypothetical protein